MENLVTPPLQESYRGRRVLVTGHTGFKGAWMSEWLLALGADVAGFSLEPPTTPSLFGQLGLANRMRHQIGDIRNAEALREAVASFAPEYVFHMAAQPLVRASYSIPVETFDTNVVGTAHLLEAVRLQATRSGKLCAVVAITTDKCYENLEQGRAFREDDRLGGHDPYSASKAAAELVIESYRKSFFSGPDSRVALASARAGNVIGGGDWALDRIVPDAMRALARGEAIPIRNRHAVRPFQHVLDPLGGYLRLGAALRYDQRTRSAFNFGPENDSHRSVEQLVTEILQHWQGEWKDASQPGAVHEAHLLHLAIEKAHDLLGWRPVWNFARGIRETVDWYRRAACENADIPAMTQAQIAAYMKDL